MTAVKKKRKNSGKCGACNVLGDYMCPGMPDGSFGQFQNKMKDEPAKES